MVALVFFALIGSSQRFLSASTSCPLYVFFFLHPFSHLRTVKKATKQEGGPHQNLFLPAHWSRLSRPQNRYK